MSVIILLGMFVSFYGLVGNDIVTNSAQKAQPAGALFRLDDNHRNGHKDDDHANQLKVQ
jgi:hypothetical protein